MLSDVIQVTDAFEHAEQALGEHQDCQNRENGLQCHTARKPRLFGKTLQPDFEIGVRVPGIHLPVVPASARLPEGWLRTGTKLEPSPMRSSAEPSARPGIPLPTV